MINWLERSGIQGRFRPREPDQEVEADSVN
jgi:hypothetical protein